jgi:hypothetical protein
MHANLSLRRKVVSIQGRHEVTREEWCSGRRDIEQKHHPKAHARDSGARKQTGYVGRPGNAGEGGHHGYGSESVRPYLRAQLRLKELMARAGGGLFPPAEDDQKPAKR